MKFQHDDHEHEVYLLDEGALDTVILVDGKRQPYSQEFAAYYRDELTGEMTDQTLIALAKDACDCGFLDE